MRRLLVSTALLVASCRQDAGLAPEGETHAVRVTPGQCLAPLWSGTAPDSGYVRSRLAGLLLGRDEVVCLSDEGGHWHLRAE